MKKVRLFVVIALVALMAMGIGYAAWNQDINATVSGGYGQVNVRVEALTSGIALDVPTSTWKFTAPANMIPGSTPATFVVRLWNDGTVPARYTAAEISKAVNTEILDLDVYFAGQQGGFGGVIEDEAQIIADWQKLDIPVGGYRDVKFVVSVLDDVTDAPDVNTFSFDIVSSFGLAK